KRLKKLVLPDVLVDTDQAANNLRTLIGISSGLSLRVTTSPGSASWNIDHWKQTSNSGTMRHTIDCLECPLWLLNEPPSTLTACDKPYPSFKGRKETKKSLQRNHSPPKTVESDSELSCHDSNNPGDENAKSQIQMNNDRDEYSHDVYT
ncbi:hypothetical protein BGZ65_003055, partial [Modicella reniformis]